MFLLSGLPSLTPRQINITLKPLTKGCKGILDDLKTRINEHYGIGDPSRISWNSWFALHAPANEEEESYVLTHRYTDIWSLHTPISGLYPKMYPFLPPKKS